MAHVAIHVGDGKFTVLHTVDDLLHLCGLSGFHEVVAGLYLADGGQTLANANPVGHHNALKAPVVTQDAGQQVVIAHGVQTVNLVVGGHNGPRVALAYGNLEAAQVELAGGTLADVLIDAGAVSFLGVDGKVFGRYAHTL